eukprot:6924302-Pyramimonas_sp.AAC.1
MSGKRGEDFKGGGEPLLLAVAPETEPGKTSAHEAWELGALESLEGGCCTGPAALEDGCCTGPAAPEDGCCTGPAGGPGPGGPGPGASGARTGPAGAAGALERQRNSAAPSIMRDGSGNPIQRENNRSLNFGPAQMRR